MPPDDQSANGFSAWNPGLGSGIPDGLRHLETIFRPECAFTAPDEARELAGLTGLPQEELTVFRPGRLVLHEVIVRVTADIAVAEGDSEEVFGHNFRRIALKILADYVAPELAAIERAYADLHEQADAMVRRILAESLNEARAAPVPVTRRFPFSLFDKQRSPAASAEPVQAREHRALSHYKAAGTAAGEPLLQSVYKSLYRVLGSIAARQGRIGSDLDLLARLVTRHVCNTYGSRRISQLLAPLIDAAISDQGYARTRNRANPILISLKGASAAGKSSLRPMLKQVMREQGIESDGYATISPDVWRRMLLDYDSLGPAYKYAGHLTSREVAVIDGKLDRYIRHKAYRDRAIPHILVDRFRFDSFSSEQVALVLHNTYARYVATMYMYFVVTPPEDTVERGWQRALERGRYKSVEDFLAHSVEAYTGMPKILFKWLASSLAEYRYFFVDNRVPKGTFPPTIAFGDRSEITIYDPVALIDIERYQKINIHATSRDEVHPPQQANAVSMNAGFLKELVRRIPEVKLADRASGAIYLRARNRVFEVVDQATLARALENAQARAAIKEIAPHAVETRSRSR